MKDNFDIYSWNQKRRLTEARKLEEAQAVNLPTIPDSVLNIFANQIKNPQTMASAVIALVNKLAEKENENILKNPKIARAIDLLKDIDPADGEVEEALKMTASTETLRKIIFKLLDDGQIQPETADDILNAISNSPSDNIYEARVDREVAERIEGLLNQQLKAKFLNYFQELYTDLVQDDLFYAEDVVNHLNNEMHKIIKVASKDYLNL